MIVHEPRFQHADLVIAYKPIGCSLVHYDETVFLRMFGSLKPKPNLCNFFIVINFIIKENKKGQGKSHI